MNLLVNLLDGPRKPSSRVRIKTDTNAYSFNALFLSMRSKQEKVSAGSQNVLTILGRE
jgi:hypothetical protein